MPVFESTDQLYGVMGALFDRIKSTPEIADGLLEGKMVVRFHWKDPDGQATIDLRTAPIEYTLGPSELDADVEMLQSADVAHRFWLGNLNVPQAIATRKVVSKGSVPKALKLLPAVKPAFDIYRGVLTDQGLAGMIPPEVAVGRRRPGPSFWERLFPKRRREVVVPSREELNRHHIPIVDGEVDLSLPRPRAVGIPDDGDGLKRAMLERMVLVRAFEEHLSRAFADRKLPTEAIHLSIGQEATAVGACFALRPTDTMTTTHRGHGHMLAKGADLDGMMAELYGRQTGLCKGKGGSMHVTDAGVGALGANGIVGASTVITSGAALASRLAGDDHVSLAFMGDGATNQGMFHEGVNFAAVFDLPAVFVVENNLYGEFTPLADHTRATRLADRAAAYGIPGVQVDGNDVWAVYQAIEDAVSRARRGEGPTLVESLTYRWHGHMEGDEMDYRPSGELERWKDRDPIVIWNRRLVEEGVVAAEELEALEQTAAEAVAQAAANAEGAPDVPIEWMADDVFAPEPAALYRPAPPVPATRTATFSGALYEAIAEEMARDTSVFLMGEDVVGGGYFAVTSGLGDEFPGRIIDTPISEYAIGGAAVGAAMCGLRPIAEILFSDFLTTVMDPIVNQAAKLRYMSGGQYAVPLVIRTPGGAGLGMAAQHSQSLEALLTGIPGLIVIAPSNPADAKGLLKAAIRSSNPVLFFENKLLYLEVGEIPEGEYLVPIGSASVRRQGTDATLVAVGGMVPVALESAESLAAEGIDVEVVDPRTLVPLDAATIVESVARTGRLVTVEEAVLTHGFGAEIVARVTEIDPGMLKAPARRVAAKEVPIAYARELERATVPDVEAISAAVREVVDG
jgi:pyruvate/2-oxoglutarate/acetoin dehydrogenase E1 component/TPP-dependent pyruvate/acetoin dehydrogenase alpha subunit